MKHSVWSYLLWIFLSTVCKLPAQDADTTVWFESISISSSSLIDDDIDSISLDEFPGQIMDALRREANIYFRDFGPGSSSTVSMFGSRSNEVALIWNGIKISNPMLGVNDYSMISPTSLTGLKIAPPGHATIFGAGSSAGAIILEQGLSSEIESGTASFGWSTLQSWNAHGSINAGKQSWQSRTSATFNQSSNNFPYTTLDGHRKKLPHARSENLDVNHHSAWDTKNNKQVQLSVWGRNHFREIPPTLTEVQSEADQSDKFIRSLFQFHLLQPVHKWNLKAYHGYQQQIYRNPLIDIHATHVYQQFQGRIDNSWDIGDGFFLRYGANANYFTSHSDNYQGKKSQTRLATYGQLQYRLSNDLQLTALIQPEWVTGLEHTGTGWTSEFKFRYRHEQWGIWKVFILQNIVWPTLNDLYWTPGGNPELQQEQNKMAGLSWERRWPFRLTHSLTFYWKWGKNWIQWIPTDLGFWRPFNTLEGQNLGIRMELSHKWGTELEVKGGYQYVKSTTSDGNFSWQQSIYSPRHMWNLGGQYFINDSWIFYLLGEYTSTRYVTRDHTQSLKPYFLCHSSVMYQFKKPALKLGLQVSNWFNIQYQGIINRPMPGRQIQLTSQIKFK